MSVKFSELHCKEVICVSDGRRLGFVTDAVLELPEGKLCAIVVPCRGKLFGLVHTREDYVIPWGCIRKMGPDIILVDVRPEECRSARARPGLPF